MTLKYYSQTVAFHLKTVEIKTRKLCRLGCMAILISIAIEIFQPEHQQAGKKWKISWRDFVMTYFFKNSKGT